ncbi:hypothetical protein A3C23_05060 [Candidatus Roizmanbacteria bacterium RIFCSPHIGHO2_02_FULL_37_13b]|nr:MAG: hypothetical protein A3C23_05060 [Candidatus Roizmanbacteria bacterium RIFCSPHIGHO2_02_FULL_37_13b]
MSTIEYKLHRMSPNQLKALFLLAKSEQGIISSSNSAPQIGKKGKALGGVFSSLARQNINGEPLVLPWGRPENNRGLKWKLNEKIITKSRLLEVVKELLS